MSVHAFKLSIPGSKAHMQNVLKHSSWISQPAAFSHTNKKKKKESFHKKGLRSLTCRWASNSVRIIYIHPQHETGFFADGNI